jgi:hypothetical protein
MQNLCALSMAGFRERFNVGKAYFTSVDHDTYVSDICHLFLDAY